jgi:hypothetical protein
MLRKALKIFGFTLGVQHNEKLNIKPALKISATKRKPDDGLSQAPPIRLYIQLQTNNLRQLRQIPLQPHRPAHKHILHRR